MTELAAPQPSARDRVRALEIAAAAVGRAFVAAGALTLLHHRAAPVAAERTKPTAVAQTKPRHHDPAATARRSSVPKVATRFPRSTDAVVSRLAAAGLDRGLFTPSPGGAPATAA